MLHRHASGLAVLAIGLFATTTALAQDLVSPAVDVRLFAEDGSPLEGEHLVRVSLYASATAVEPLSKEESSLEFVNGVVAAPVGQMDAERLPDQLWVGIGVDGRPERVRLALPVAANATVTIDEESQSIRRIRTLQLNERIPFDQVTAVEIRCRRTENQVAIVFGEAGRTEIRRGTQLREFAESTARMMDAELTIASVIAEEDALRIARGFEQALPRPAHAADCAPE